MEEKKKATPMETPTGGVGQQTQRILGGGTATLGWRAAEHLPAGLPGAAMMLLAARYTTRYWKRVTRSGASHPRKRARDWSWQRKAIPSSPTAP